MCSFQCWEVGLFHVFIGPYGYFFEWPDQPVPPSPISLALSWVGVQVEQ